MQDLRATTINTPIGHLYAIANSHALIFLDFVKAKKHNSFLQSFCKKHGITKISGTNAVLTQLRSELEDYFHKQRTTFTIPLQPWGTPFQQQAWRALSTIPYGTRCSYTEQAATAMHPRAIRAIANANKHNPIALLIPCHRVVTASRKPGGYRGDAWRKEWLLKHESI